VDAGGPLSVRQARDRDEARPAATSIEVRQVRVEQQIRRAWIRQTASAEVRLANRTRERHCTFDEPSDLCGVVGPGMGGGARRGAHPREACRLVVENSIAKPGRLRDQIKRACALARGVVEAPAGIGPVEVECARTLLPRRAAREVGTAQATAISGEHGLREQRWQPVGGGGAESLLHRRQIVPALRGGDVIEVDHECPVRPGERGRSRRG
jgi:hypothetical protein